MKRHILVKVLNLIENVLILLLVRKVEWYDRTCLELTLVWVISPYLFALYLYGLSGWGIGCVIVLYDDDILLISTSACQLEEYVKRTVLVNSCGLRTIRYLGVFLLGPNIFSAPLITLTAVFIGQLIPSFMKLSE